MRRGFCLTILFIAAAGCNSQTDVSRIAGFWPGQFVVESVDGSTEAKTVEPEVLKGYLQLYANNQKFKLEMRNKHQGLFVDGTWTVKGGRLRIVGDTFSFDNPSELDQKTYGLKPIPPEDVRTVFGKGLVFDMSANRRELAGLKTSLGRLLGHFHFSRPIPR